MRLVSSHRLGFRLPWRTGIWVGAMIGMLSSTACSNQPEIVQSRPLRIQQQWQLQPGSTVAGRQISGGLGDISVELEGSTVHAPFEGKAQPYGPDCLIYSTPEVPAYLFRLCGLEHIYSGDVRQGEALGKGQLLQFAALRKQPDGQWAMVEPSSAMLERILTRPN